MKPDRLPAPIEKTRRRLIEHLTNTYTEVTVNGNPASRFVDGKWIPLSGENIWGFVPVVYIPHIRVYSFYGETFIDSVQGVIKEMTLRLADFGDAITADAHRYLGMRNVSGAPTIQQLAPALYAVNLHSNPMMTGQEAEPDLFELGQSRASDPMQTIIDLLYLIHRRLVAVPAVANGEDEGASVQD